MEGGIIGDIMISIFVRLYLKLSKKNVLTKRLTIVRVIFTQDLDRII